MEHFKTIDDILDFAIKNEEMAAELYDRLAKEAKNAATKKFWEDLKEEEIVHKVRLQGMKEGKLLNIISGKIMDLKIADYLPEAEISENSDYQEALVFAMQAEKAEYKLYKDLAAKTDDPDMKKNLLILAQEEAKHKLQLEIEYDEFILQEG